MDKSTSTFVQREYEPQMSGTITTASSCFYELPCGICRLTMKDCPKRTIPYKPQEFYYSTAVNAETGSET